MFTELLQKRYTCKHYDANKTLSREEINKILEAARLTPSAVNLQPWRFLVIDDRAKMEQLEPAIMETNKVRFKDVPALILICARTENTDEDIERVLDKEEADGRFPDPTFKDAQRKGRTHFRNLHLDDAVEWNAKQCYAAMCSILYAAEDMGIDSTPVEGVFLDKVDEILDLKSKGLACQLLVFLGHRVNGDTNQLMFRPKSRLSFEDVVTYL